jgi:hypothetical protein
MGARDTCGNEKMFSKELKRVGSSMTDQVLRGRSEEMLTDVQNSVYQGC